MTPNFRTNRINRVLGWRVMFAAVFAAATVQFPAAAFGQQPICPQPTSEQLYFSTCQPKARIAAAHFLSEFTIDHFFKVAPPPFRRSPSDFVTPLARTQLQANEDLTAQLDSLPDLRFTKLDTSTGTFSMNVDEERRWVETVLKGWAQDHGFAFSLPQRLEGGYWRTPSVLQMSFWEGRRAVFKIKPSKGTQIGGELNCLSISTEGVRLVIDGPNDPDFLIMFEGCR